MNKKQRADLDIISRIDEEIIDKNTEKRIKLMSKKRSPRWIIPSGIAAAIALIIIIPIFVVLFAKQVPIYEGMTVSHTNVDTLANPFSNGNIYNFDFLAANGEGDNGNHYGNNKKPIEDIVEEDTSISIEIPEQPMYYANPDQDVYITVHVSNPDSFEILSFTLNGKKYSSYMFEQGSDMENLILKVNVGSDAGIREYTIDAIKYVDGTEIKDVDMRGERTVKVGIYSAGIQPSVNVTNEIVGINEVSFTASLSDSYALIERSGGKAFAGIYSDNGIVAYKEIQEGTTELFFDGLDTYTTYRYAIVAYYDALDGNEMDYHVLYEKEFTTQSVVAPDNVQIDQTSISFGLSFNEKYKEKSVTSISVYRGEEKVKELDVSGDVTSKTFSATELLSNNTYKIVIAYENAGKTETVEFTLTTAAKAEPDFEITETEKTQTSFKFDIAITDVDAVGTITKVELIHGEDTTNVEDLTTREFTDLLSNNDYTAKITYTYDLNDGVGEHIIEKTLDVKTEAKATPDFTITETEKTQTSFKFDVAITDVDAVGAITKIELIHGEDVTNVENLTAREITNLLSNNDYTVKVTYTYDLNDGIGNQTLVKELAVKTEEKVEPTFTIKDVTSDTYTISGAYDQTNVDNTLISYTVQLFKGDELVKENTDKKIEFDSLDYYTDYTVRITYTFDVNDGKGVQTKTVEQSIKTTPYIDVTSTTILDKKDAYFDGDMATLRINIDNPLAARVEYVIIDGKTYAANDSSTSKIILVDVEDVGGLGSATVEGFIVSIDSNEYTVKDITQTKLDILIIGKMVITSWEFVDKNFEPIEYASVSDKVYLVFTADKITGNTVTQVKVMDVEYNTDDIKTLDDGKFYVELKDKEAKGYRGYPNVTYKNDYIDSAMAEVADFAQHPFVLLNSTDVRYVSTPQEFMAMEDGYYYELTCDLDFSEVGNWEMRRFFGIIDGKEYAIKNLLLFAGVGAGDSSYDYNSGMFTCFCGIMQNIRFESFIYIEKNERGIFDATGIIGHAEKDSIIRNCTIDETSEIASTRTYTYLGGICGWSEGVIENCESKARITYSFNEHAGFSIPSYLAIGGICGESKGSIEGCTSYATIESKAGNVGGICGISYGLIENCINHGKISCQSNTGIGGICGASFADIKNCTNYGSLTNKNSVGGICGNAYLDYVTVENVTVENCNNYGDINSTFGSIGGIIAPTYNNTIVKNCNNYGNMTIGDGFDELSSAYAIGGSVMQNCSNYGTIKVVTSCPEDYDDDRIANIFEQFDENDVNCYNYGAIYFNDTVIKEATSTPEE